MRRATLLFLKKENQILLAMKKRGFGAGRWNGVGGKPDEGETIKAAAIRECQEEIEVTPTTVKKAAVINFFWPEKKDYNQQVIVYVCTKWTGEPTETEEMAPKWYALDKIPYDKMWADDKYWLPKVIAGEFVTAEFHFDDDDGILKYSIKP